MGADAAAAAIDAAVEAAEVAAERAARAARLVTSGSSGSGSPGIAEAAKLGVQAASLQACLPAPAYNTGWGGLAVSHRANGYACPSPAFPQGGLPLSVRSGKPCYPADDHEAVHQRLVQQDLLSKGLRSQWCRVMCRCP